MRLFKKTMLVLGATLILSAFNGGPAMANRGGGGDDGGAPELVAICHLDAQGHYTLTSVDPDTVPGLLQQGDVYPATDGTCPADVAVEAPPPVAVCHLDDQNHYVLTTVDADEVQALLNQGYVLATNGACPSDPVLEVAGTTAPAVAVPSEEPAAPAVEAVHEPATQPGLPRTGGAITEQTIVGLILVGAGTLLLALRRRRPSSTLS